MAISAAVAGTQAIGVPAASASSVGPVVAPGASVPGGQCAVSPDGAFSFCMQTDGNLVAYGPGGELWTSATTGRGGSQVVNQTDGNLVIYTPAGAPVWSSETPGRGATVLAVQADGNVVSYAGGAPVWTTHTAGGVSRLASSYAVAFARAQIGKPYVWGAAGPGAYDCSGLTMSSYAAAGVGLPHRAALQFQLGTPISRDALIPGDLVFSYSGPGHVGIYVGNGQMVASPNSSGVVRYDPVDAWGYYVGARRVA